MVLSGYCRGCFLQACKAAGELGEREQKKLEAAVARVVVSAQDVRAGSSNSDATLV